MAQTQNSLILQVLLFASTTSNGNTSALKKKNKTVCVYLYPVFPENACAETSNQGHLETAAARSREKQALWWEIEASRLSAHVPKV